MRGGNTEVVMGEEVTEEHAAFSVVTRVNCEARRDCRTVLSFLFIDEGDGGGGGAGMLEPISGLSADWETSSAI